MSKSDDMKRTREEITDEDREFMRQMADRMPRLSLQNNPKGRGKGGQLNCTAVIFEGWKKMRSLGERLYVRDNRRAFYLCGWLQ